MNHFEQQSYYELLEIPFSASLAQILGAYEQAMETYAPDSIAVYTLVDPGQLQSLHQRLAQARDVLSALEQRLEYDRLLGVKRTPEELATLRTESLQRAAAAEVPSLVEPVLAEAPMVAEAPTVAEAPVEPPVGVEAPVSLAPAEAPVVAEAAVVTEAPVVTEALVVAEAPVVAETAVSLAPPPAPVETEAVELSEAEVVEPAAAVETAPVPAPVVPAAAPVAALVPLVPLESAGKPVVHSRPSAPVGRHGVSRPPPLPSRSALRPSPGRPEPILSRLKNRAVPPQSLGEAPVLAQAAAIATAEAAYVPVAIKARDSRTRLKTVVDISADAEFNGELLRQVREGRGISPQSLAERTRISVRHVENIEADRYDALPVQVYLRGMLMSLARELGLDPLRVSRSYMALATSEKKKR